ncbi:MAG: putative ATP-dependent DNA helicase PIF1 [Streblomastix strix]|uniref:Putative ATP-dependent DNA helicase PIF1 n=1 Tax=Streblomastix strix TaxID=222440 RepID=A0A5J4WDT8_9EUKA|nr:MAG: putative ATP-dependent DNA helicase PIF1 [Streblomastix strix]
MECQSRLFESVDTLKAEFADDKERFTDEFMHSVTRSGLSPHRLILNISAIVLFLRNSDVKRGLCNGTRLAINEFSTHYLKLQGIVEKFLGKQFFMPRFDLEPTNANKLFQITIRKFLIHLELAMNIDKSQ